MDMEKTSAVLEPSTPKLDPQTATVNIFVDPVIERRALRKFDKYLLPQMAILVLIAYLDRSNIGNVPAIEPIAKWYINNIQEMPKCLASKRGLIW